MNIKERVEQLEHMQHISRALSYEISVRDFQEIKEELQRLWKIEACARSVFEMNSTGTAYASNENYALFDALREAKGQE